MTKTTPGTSTTSTVPRPNPALRRPHGHVLQNTYVVSLFSQCCLQFEPIVLVLWNIVNFILIKNLYAYFTWKLISALQGCPVNNLPVKTRKFRYLVVLGFEVTLESQKLPQELDPEPSVKIMFGRMQSLAKHSNPLTTNLISMKNLFLVQAVFTTFKSRIYQYLLMIMKIILPKPFYQNWKMPNRNFHQHTPTLSAIFNISLKVILPLTFPICFVERCSQQLPSSTYKQSLLLLWDRVSFGHKLFFIKYISITIIIMPNAHWEQSKWL